MAAKGNDSGIPQGSMIAMPAGMHTMFFNDFPAIAL